ncbi:histidine phosphatase family protein [Vibrio scophthalmi]|uniref:histidine phosphatase family protein n=1 Tax=Vibrio scophthalmi TaxID=45658 RepID=UPI0022852620|nr:histidine phosphatase family protein [Vibrio scophthalmi]MCY9805588.1 histidine phosphatase family protein [Vibrio scophthalmi]
MKSVNIYLLRHGKTLGEAALNGHTDVLVASSVQQSICSGLLKINLPFEHVVSSPLRRCRDLAMRLVVEKPSLSLQVNPEFQEMNFGQFDGVPFDQLSQQWPMLERFWQDPVSHPLPGSELIDAFYQRISDGWQALAQSAEQDTLLIAHGGTIRMILANTLGLDWRNPALFSTLQLANQSISHIKITHADKIYVQICSIGTPLSGLSHA